MKLRFAAKFTIFLDLELAFAFNIHIYLIPVCNVILIFTDGTNHAHKFSRPLFCHVPILYLNLQYRNVHVIQ